jgi:hypothetical protein
MVFAGSATAAIPNGLVLVTKEPTASPTATLDPNATPCIKELTVGGPADLTFCSSPSPAATETPLCLQIAAISEPTPSPSVCPTTFQGATATPCVKVLVVGPNAPAQPTATASACPTPFQSFQGETATPRDPTPPPTSTTSDSSTGDTAPPIGLFVGLSLGALGLMAIATRRQAIRR